jgi:hypothetical protein
MDTDSKLCINCKHFLMRDPPNTDDCGRTEMKDMVRGKVWFRSCFAERIDGRDHEACGPAGRFFEQHEARGSFDLQAEPG